MEIITDQSPLISIKLDSLETLEVDHCEALQLWHNYFVNLILKNKENENG
jgi:hypothetical protein